MTEGPDGNRRALAPSAVARTLMGQAAAAPDLRDRVQTRAAGDALTVNASAESGPRPSARNALTVDAGVSGAAPLVSDPALPRYEAMGELGRGGMGCVDEVFDRVLGRPVAQKRLLRVADPRNATMLVAEAQTCAQLEHPSIVPVYDLDAAADGRPFYTMRVVRGRSLREVIDDNADQNKARTPLARLLGTFRQVCLAVDYAHSRGVVHRDLKPENIVVGEFGEVYVVDWGIAHLIEGSDVRRSGYQPAIAGTPAYMAPEQISGDDLDGRADVFALGVMLFELLTGDRPFSDDSMQGVLTRRGKRVDRGPSQIAPGGAVPSFFDQLVLACLSPEKHGRPGRARVIASTIDDYLDQERARAEREREAAEYAREGDAARERFATATQEARELEERGEALLADAKPWHDAASKAPAWELSTRASALRSDAARERARASAAFTSALGRVSDHPAARGGLAQLYFHQFVEAEEAGDEQRMAQYLDLARTYDDGALALELRNQGQLEIATRPTGARLRIARYARKGPLLVLGDERDLGAAPVNAGWFDAGSYLISAEQDGRTLRYPLLIRRAQRHLIDLRMPGPDELPDGMVLVPGGPFLSNTDPRAPKLRELELPDFSIGRFPVTLREYGEYLDDLADDERELRMPIIDGVAAYSPETRSWKTELFVSGDALKYLPPDRELDLPVVGIRWNAARAYAAWLARRTGRPYRLPTDPEWDKAMRGADGRPFSMGVKLDPAFAKLRDSRKEIPTPEPVGAFASDESPYGIRDLCGSVGDWTETALDELPLPDLAEADSGEADYRIVIWRGGTWSSTAPNTPMRYTQAVRHKGAWIGFRLALDATEHSRTARTPLAG